MAALRDPLADLKAEIAAEAAREPDPSPPDPADDEGEPPAASVEEPPEATEPEKAAQEEIEGRKPKPKGKETAARMVPAERLNEYAVKNRQQAKQLEELTTRIDRMEHPERYAENPPETEETLRAKIRGEEREALRRESFLMTGYEAFGKKPFDDACNQLASLLPTGAGPGFVSMVIDTFEGNMDHASKAIKILSEMDVPETEAFLAKKTAAQIRQLGELVRARPRPATGKRPKLEEDEEAPEPLRPLKGGGRVEEGLGDDVPDDIWFKRFDERVLNKPRPH